MAVIEPNTGTYWLDVLFTVGIIASSIVTYAMPYRRSMVREDGGHGKLNRDGRQWIGLIVAMWVLWVAILWAQAVGLVPLHIATHAYYPQGVVLP